MSDHPTTPTTAEPVSPEDMFYAGLYWVWDVPGLGLRAADPGECATEIKRLHTVIRAAREETRAWRQRRDGSLPHSEALRGVMSNPADKPTTAELIVMFFDAWGDRYSELRDHDVIGPVYKRAYEAYDTLKRRHDFTTSSRLAREQAVAEILNAAK